MSEAPQIFTLPVPAPEGTRSDPLPPGLAERVEWPAAGGDPSPGATVRLAGPVSALDIWQLRNVAPDDPTWQQALDDVDNAVHGPKAYTGSRYPTTMWGLLLADLKQDDPAGWLRFIEVYRRPIGRSIVSICRQRGIPCETWQEVGDQFFSWFVAQRAYLRIRRTGRDGKIFRFRGFLKACIRTFIRTELANDRTRDWRDLDEEPGTSGEWHEVGLTIDREYCEQIVSEEAAVMATAQPSMWRALMRSVQGQSPEEIAREISVQTDGKGAVDGAGSRTAQPSRATAYRMVQRAREAFRSRLIQYRLQNASLSEEEAVAEFQELIPQLAAALHDVVKRQSAG